MARCLVLMAEASVQVMVSTDYDAVLTVDGQVDMDVNSADTIHMAMSERVSRFVRLDGHNYFYRTLLQRLRVVSQPGSAEGDNGTPQGARGNVQD